MKTRLVVALIVSIVALPVVFFGLIDPLEGGLALLLAVGLSVVVRLLSGVRVPRLAWIPLLVAVAVGALALGLALINMPTDPVQEVGPEVTAPNPLGPGLVALIWVYRLAVLVLLSGAVVYVVRIAQAVRSGAALRGEVVTDESVGR